MGDKTHHHIWAFALLAWVAMVVIPTAFISISWMLGISTDSSAPNVFDLLPFAFFFSVPGAFVAFALLAPLAIATDRALRGRTPRLLNIMLGGLLGLSAFALFVAGSVLLRLPTPFSPNSMIAGGVSLNTLRRVLTAPQTPSLLALFVVSGMLVALGLRHRAATVRPA